ncbi:glycosyltransferase family 1 protein [Candidatus Saccharibacteria bacterium]|nr:glycosyltransferase family 1 protein [Candidatus Saccharibacteria bacterium]
MKKPLIIAQIMGKWLGGGVEAIIMNYYHHIDRNKIQFDFICDEDSTNIPYDEIEKLGGKVILCPPYQKLPKYLKFLTQLFREKKYHIVHSNINTLSVFPLYAAKKAGVPVRIAHSHSTSNPREWKKNLAKNALRPFSKQYATDYFACSELAGRYLFGDQAFDKGKVKIIRNAIDVEKFKFDPVARKKLRKEIGIKDDDFVVGHIGRFVEQKNHRFLIDIFAEAKKEKKNAKLVLVGQGPLREEIRQKVEDLGLQKDVFFLGQRNDTNKLYSVFDVFCLPSLYEGLPVVGVEAQANGVPCVFSDQVTEEIAINKNVKLVDTEKSISTVAKDIIKSSKRIEPNNYLFDIRKESKRFSDYYGEYS